MNGIEHISKRSRVKGERASSKGFITRTLVAMFNTEEVVCICWGKLNNRREVYKANRRGMMENRRRLNKMHEIIYQR